MEVIPAILLQPENSARHYLQSFLTALSIPRPNHFFILHSEEQGETSSSVT